MRRILALSALLLPMHLACGDDSGSSSDGCTPVEGGAQCCADIAPAPEDIVCPEGSERQVVEATGSVFCEEMRDGRGFQVGPYVNLNDTFVGGVSGFGSADIGEESFGCHSNGYVARRNEVTEISGDSCQLECWDEQGQPIECEGPCD
jgi:hypothetical protein